VLKTITSSDLRNRIRHVLNEVGYGQSQYIVEKFGEPTAAIISMQDFHLLQSAKRDQGTASLQQVIADLRLRNREVDATALDALIEEARAEFHASCQSSGQGSQSNAD